MQFVSYLLKHAFLITNWQSICAASNLLNTRLHHQVSEANLSNIMLCPMHYPVALPAKFNYCHSSQTCVTGDRSKSRDSGASVRTRSTGSRLGSRPISCPHTRYTYVAGVHICSCTSTTSYICIFSFIERLGTTKFSIIESIGNVGAGSTVCTSATRLVPSG